MAWAMVAGAAISVVGGAVASNKASKAAKGNVDAATQAQYAAIDSQEKLATQQMDYQKTQFDYFKDRQVGIDATADRVTNAQLAQADETAAQGRDIYNYQKDVFRPVEQSLVSQAMRESTPEYYEKFAQKAVAGQAMANRNATGQMERSLASMGVNPNSGAYAAQARGLQLANAAGLGAVANDSRDQAENLAWARKADVAGLGKGLVGAGNASYGLATGANQAAMGATLGANGAAVSGQGTATQYGGLATQGFGSTANGYGDIARNQSNIYAITSRQEADDQAGWASAMGSFGKLAAQYYGGAGKG